MFSLQTAVLLGLDGWTSAGWSMAPLIGIALVISFYLGWHLAHQRETPEFGPESQSSELDQTRIEARTDPLCGIGNRKAVDERLELMVARFHSKADSFGLMVVDVDHFKHVNDTFGHPAGDKVLTDIAAALIDCVRPEDFVGRLGGDEFIVLFDGLTVANAQIVAARVQASIERHDFKIESSALDGADRHPQSTVVTLSMGLAIIGIKDDTASIYQRADRALYKSKELGRNRLYTLLEKV